MHLGVIHTYDIRRIFGFFDDLPPLACKTIAVYLHELTIPLFCGRHLWRPLLHIPTWRPRPQFLPAARVIPGKRPGGQCCFSRGLKKRSRLITLTAARRRCISLCLFWPPQLSHSTEMVKKSKSRLRELAATARGSQDAGTSDK